MDDVVRLLARLAQPLAVLLEELVGLLARALGGVDRLRDRVRALLERLLDPREGEPLEDEEADQERDQRPDHQPEPGRDQEAAALLLALPRGGEHQDVR